MKFFARSVCIFAAKSYAVVPGGIKKQSGSVLPWLSVSLLTPPGKTVMYFKSWNTVVSIASCTPVLPYLSRNFCTNSSAFFCFSSICPVIMNFGLPGKYSISFLLFASFNASSHSELTGTMMYSGNCFLHLSRLGCAVGRSILFATIIIGFVLFLIIIASWWRCSSVHPVGCSGSNFRDMIASFTRFSVTFNPDNCFASEIIAFPFSCCICRANLSHPFLIMLSIHMSSSISRNLMSNAGS